jgi:hypothetical protein
MVVDHGDPVPQQIGVQGTWVAARALAAKASRRDPLRKPTACQRGNCSDWSPSASAGLVTYHATLPAVIIDHDSTGSMEKKKQEG